MSQEKRVVLDTNVVVSGLLFPGSVPAIALLKAQSSIVLSSQAIRDELTEVLARPRFDRYVSQIVRKGLSDEFLANTIDVPIRQPLHICRDPRDDKFLEAAIHGQADAIITGDHDLLTLDPFRGIRILSPAEYLLWQTA